jgi:hypothetical protein
MSALCAYDHAALVACQAEASGPEKALLDPRAVATVRYADEAAWTVATAVARLLEPGSRALPAAPEQVGLVVASALGPAVTMAAVGAEARALRASPLRFPAANPGSMAGVSCILFGLRGPAINLLLPPERGGPLACFLAGCWLERGAAEWMAVVTAAPGQDCACLARAVLLTRDTAVPAAGTLCAARDWLSGGGTVHPS